VSADGENSTWNPIPFPPTGWTLFWIVVISAAIVTALAWWLWQETKRY
jgi:hypothetical protein